MQATVPAARRRHRSGPGRDEGRGDRRAPGPRSDPDRASLRTGGQLRIAAKIKGRGEIGGVIDHLDVMIGKYGVDLRLGWSPTAAEVLALEPAPRHRGHRFGAGDRHRRKPGTGHPIHSGPGPGPCAVGLGCARGRQARRDSMSSSSTTVKGAGRASGWRCSLQADGHDVEFVTPLPYVGAKLGPFSANLAVPRVHQSGMTTHPFTTVTAVDGADRAYDRAGSIPAPSPASTP